MLPAEFELLLKVLSAPDDDLPRLVYADVLQERGDERGEFIPIQCQLAQPDVRSNPERFAQLRAREGELLTEFGQSWVEQAIPFRCVGHFARGFVEELQCLPGELLHRGLEVVAPVRALWLDGDTPALLAQRVLALPLGGKVKELTLRLIDSRVDSSLAVAGGQLLAVRQLCSEPRTVPLLEAMGWLSRLQRLELPVSGRPGLFSELAALKPPALAQLWLHRGSGESVGRPLFNAVEEVWRAMPELTVRWRGTDYRSTELSALADELGAMRVQVGNPVVQSETPAPLFLPGNDPVVQLIVPDPVESAPGPVQFEEVTPVKPLPSTAPWDRWLQTEQLRPRGFLPRALPERVTVIRALDRGTPVLVVVGPADTMGALPFANDVALGMTLKNSAVLQLRRNGTVGNERGAVSEPFEGVTLWELLALHHRLPPGVVLRALSAVARAAVDLERWPSTDDVLLSARGDVKVMSGFPETTRFEEPSYAGNEERHLMGIPLEDPQARGAKVRQLGTALFELLTGTALFDVTRRSMFVLAGDWSVLLRRLDREGLSLVRVDSALAVFEPLLAKTMSHARGERFESLAACAAALELHSHVASPEELARLVRDALMRVPRTRNGR